MFPAATPQYIWPSYKISHRVAPLHGPHYLRPAYKCPILSTKGQRKWKYKYFPLQILVQRFSPIILFRGKGIANTFLSTNITNTSHYKYILQKDLIWKRYKRNNMSVQYDSSCLGCVVWACLFLFAI